MDEHLEGTRDAPAVPNTLLQQHEGCLLLAVDYHMAAAGAVSFSSPSDPGVNTSAFAHICA